MYHQFPQQMQNNVIQPVLNPTENNSRSTNSDFEQKNYSITPSDTYYSNASNFSQQSWNQVDYTKPIQQINQRNSLQHESQMTIQNIVRNKDQNLVLEDFKQLQQQQQNQEVQQINQMLGYQQNNMNNMNNLNSMNNSILNQPPQNQFMTNFGLLPFGLPIMDINHFVQQTPKLIGILTPEERKRKVEKYLEKKKEDYGNQQNIKIEKNQQIRDKEYKGDLLKARPQNLLLIQLINKEHRSI